MSSILREIKLLTITEVAGTLRVSNRTLVRMIQQREIPAFKIGGQWRIPESGFREWFEERRNPNPVKD
jgi:excisionase family DNA binding protein